MQDQSAVSNLLVTPKQAAEMLAVSSRKLWGLTFEDTPGLPYVRLGRCVRYSTSDLEKWIEDRKIGGAK